MLVEFNTIFYKELFYKLKDHVLFFGLRRPPIWNLHSYSIIRKSNSKLIFMSQLSTRELENKISEGMRHVKINFNKLFTNESLASFFVINGISIWELVKPSIENLISRHGEEAITNIEIIQKALTKFKPRKILILSESGQTEQIIIAKAKEVGIPVVLLQHGNLHDNPSGHKYNQFTGSIKSKSDQFIVWGKSMLKYSQEYNLPVASIQALGSPYHDKLFNKSPDMTCISNDSYRERFSNVLSAGCRRSNKRLFLK